MNNNKRKYFVLASVDGKSFTLSVKTVNGTEAIEIARVRLLKYLPTKTIVIKCSGLIKNA